MEGSGQLITYIYKGDKIDEISQIIGNQFPGYPHYMTEF